MKKGIIAILAIALAVAGCKKADLQLSNPNAPTPESLKTKAGVESFALGIFNKWIADGANAFTNALTFHSVMGDEEWSSVGNWGARYTQQINSINLPAPYNTKVPNIFGVTQNVQLKSLNTLPATNSQSNALAFEWSVCYYINGQANLLLAALADNSLPVSTSERKTLQAWAYWWKGIAYSRVGSMYLSGIINNNTDGTTNNTYIGHDAIVTEGNANFDKAAALLSGMTADADYTATITAIIPSFNVTATQVSPAMWLRDCYTYEARNYLANHKVATMSAADWTTVNTLAGKGLQNGDVTFVFGMDPTGTNDLTAGGTQGHPYLWNSYYLSPGWNWISERLIQDFKTGDARFTKGVSVLDAPQINRSSRGIQFGTRYYPTAIEDGGYWSTNEQKGQLQFAGSWEENALMLAEAAIQSGNTDAGLAYVDQVRDAQGSGLTHVSGTGLAKTAALEELRKERRIGLFLRGVAFYDARRWGVTAPASSGGGRAGAIVLVPQSLLGNTGPSYQALPCFIDYSYNDYWDIPVSELSFNTPASGSAATAN